MNTIMVTQISIWLSHRQNSAGQRLWFSSPSTTYPAWHLQMLELHIFWEEALMQQASAEASAHNAISCGVSVAMR